ncbi:MAG: hypothetical protein V7784_02340 [Oceanospirillaceae bacterium]
MKNLVIKKIKVLGSSLKVLTKPLKIIALSLGIIAIGSPAIAADKSTANVLEYVTFRAADNVNVDKLARVAVDIDKVLIDYPGFIDRQVSLQEDGTWVEVVYWENIETAKGALDKFLKDPKTAEFLGLVDPKSVTLVYSSIKH